MKAGKETDLARLRAMTEVDWDPAYTETAWVHHERYRLRRQRRARRIQVSIAAAACVLIGVALGTPETPPLEEPVHRFADGSLARWGEDAEWRTASESESLVEVQLARGGGRFEVVKSENRTFRVRCGPVLAEVLGTTFSVERGVSEVRVAVSEGRVRVSGPEGKTVLSAGESIVVSTLRPEPSSPEEPSALSPAEPSPTRSGAGAEAGAGPGSGKKWQRSAKRGDMDEAFELIKRQRVANRAEDLLLAADVARMTDHPGQALPYLRRVVREHPRDPRAPLAAFTLGKLLLEDLGEPLRAADAFRRVRSLKASSDLVEDALAREVECYFRAGDEERARERAERYIKRYPKGSRRALVERYGRLSSP
ncbi:MAG: FecR domain-containing protein [Myxococcota bacterium]